MVGEAGLSDNRNIPSRELRALNCPLCGSEQVQICIDINNHMKDIAKCRECKCTAPLFVWNNLVMRERTE